MKINSIRYRDNSMMNIIKMLYNKIQYISQSNFLRNTSVYAVGNILCAAIPFCLMPLLTRYLSPEDYGYIALFTVLISIYTPFVSLNLDSFIGYAYFKYENDFFYIVSTCIFTIFFSFCIVFIGTYLIYDFLKIITIFPFNLFWTIFIVCFSNSFISIVQIIQQVKGHAKDFILIQITNFIFNTFLTILFVVLLSMSWHGRIFSQLLTSIIFLFVSLIFLIKCKFLSFYFNYKYLIHGLKYGIPLIPHTLCGCIIMASDRFFISNMIDLSEVGIFSVGYSLGMVIELLATSMNKAFVPWLYKQLHQFDIKKLDNRVIIVKISYVCGIGFILLAIVYSYFMTLFVPLFLGEQFHKSCDYIIYFALSAAINALYYLVVNYIFYTSKTQYLSFLTFTSACLHIITTYIMIKIWGGIGAAYASIFTNSIVFIFTWFLSNRLYPMPWFLGIRL